jgi:hypothetical protein
MTTINNQLALTELDALAIHHALNAAEGNAARNAMEFMQNGDIHAAGYAFQAAKEAAELREMYGLPSEGAAKPEVKHIDNHAGHLTMLLSALVAFKASGLRFLAEAPEEVADVTRERLADVQSLINRVAAFLRSMDPEYCATFAKEQATIRDDLPGWKTASNEDRASFDELVSLLSGEPVPASQTRQ